MIKDYIPTSSGNGSFCWLSSVRIVWLVGRYDRYWRYHLPRKPGRSWCPRTHCSKMPKDSHSAHNVDWSQGHYPTLLWSMLCKRAGQHNLTSPDLFDKQTASQSHLPRHSINTKETLAASIEYTCWLWCSWTLADNVHEDCNMQQDVVSQSHLPQINVIAW